MMEEEEDELNFDMDIKKPMGQLSLSAADTQRENKSDVRSITETVSVFKKFNQHLEKYQLKKPSLKLNFNVKHADSRNHLKKGDSDAYKIIEQIRNRLIAKGQEPSLLKDRSSQQIVVVRVIKTEDDYVIVQDNSGVAQIMIEKGYLWVGMIVTLKISWQMGKYHFLQIISKQEVIQKPNKITNINPGQNQARITLVSGPYTEQTSIDWLGLHLVRNIVIQNNSNILIIMGPFIDYSHPKVKDNKFSKSYQQLLNDVVKYFNYQLSSVKILILPSILDVSHLFPLPQPELLFENSYQNIISIGNPSYIDSGKLTMQLINHDFVEQIRNNCTGKVEKQLIQKIYDTYLSQQMILSCTGDAPVAENKLQSLFLNQKQHAKVIVYSSRIKQANILQRGDTIFINVGSLLGNSSNVGNVVNLTYFQNNDLPICDSIYGEVIKLVY